MPLTAEVTLLFVGLSLPQALLGLPIAAAGVGPVPALGVVAVVGALMTIAAAAEAEAIARDQGMRTGGFFGHLVTRYLGSAAGSLPTGIAGARTSMSVLASYVGLSVTLAALTGLPRVLWGVLTAVAVLVLLARGGLRIPAWAGALLGLACLPVLAAIAVVAILVAGDGDLGHIDVSGSELGAVLGLTIMLYISNVYALEIAREKLPHEDPDGRALIRGSALGTVILTVIAAAWLIATSAALHPSVLHGEIGTVLGPLADEGGALAAVLGTVATVLLLGLGMERTSVAVMNLVAEWVPGRVLPIAAPLALCALGEVLLGADLVSFSGVFQVAGVATNVIVGAALPMLLLAASRRTGDLEPGARVPLFGSPAAVAVLIGFDALLLVGFATVLADDPLMRIVAVGALLALAAIVAGQRPLRRMPSSTSAASSS